MAGAFDQGYGATNSSHNTFGTATNTNQNPFASNTYGTTTSPSFSTQGFIFGGSSTGVFGAQSTFSSASSPSSSTQGSPFSRSSTGVFGASLPFSSASSPSSTQGSLFSRNSTGIGALLSPFSSAQGSPFGGSSTGVFGALPSNFSSSSSPSSSTQGSSFGRSSTDVFGASFPFSSASSSSLTQGSLFTGNSTGVFGAPLSPFSSAQGSPFGGSSTGVFGALPSHFSSASSSSSLLAQGSHCGRNSRGVFGAPSPFPLAYFSNLGFQQATAGLASHGNTSSTTSKGPFGGPSSTPCSSSSMGSLVFEAKTNVGTVPRFQIQSPPCSGTSTGLFGTSSSSFLTSPSAYRACGSTTMAGFTNTNNRSSNQTTAPSFGQTFTGLGTTPANLFSTSRNTGSTAWGENKGSRIKSYECTTTREGEQNVKHMSISAMSTYVSKSHEELRWEDYELKSGGQQNPVNNKIQELSRQPLNVTLSATPKPLFPVSLTNVNLSSPNPLPNFPIFETKKSLFHVSNSVLPQDPISPLAIAIQNPQLPTQQYSGPALSFPGQSPSVGSGCVQVNPTTSLLFWNNGSVPLDFPQPQPSPGVSPQQCFVTGKVTDSIIAVKDPFGSEPVTSQSSIACVSFVQHGISSMPVFKEPTNARPSRVSSLLMSRYHPVRPLAVNVRRYNPSTGGPKVPFFDKGEETQYTSKTYSCVVPRENPRSVFAAASTDLTSASINEVPTMKHATAVEREDGSENSKEDQTNSSTPNCLIDHLTELNWNAKEAYKLVIPKLQHPDYYTEPTIEEIASIESNNPGFCRHVNDFVVGRKGYGWVKFYGETDVRGLNLDSLIQFNDRELIVYEDCEKPPIGQGLNKAAEVTLLNVRCMDKTGKQFSSGKMVDKFVEKLKKLAEKQGAEFSSYDPVEGVWKFIVQHF